MVDARYHTADAEIIRYRSRYTERRSGGPTSSVFLGSAGELATPRNRRPHVRDGKAV